MNIANGFPCPTCGHDHADLLAIEKDQDAIPVSFRLHCTKCETVFREMRLAPEEKPSVPSGTRAF